MPHYYNSFGSYVKRTFGEIVYKVNVDAGFTCPNRDGTVGRGGCTYCNNESFRPSSCRPVIPIDEQINRGISYLSRRYGAEKFIVYFQPYTNTYADTEVLAEIYGRALSMPKVVGLAIGTRPDCVDEEKIRLISDMAKERFILIEYGLQSMYDKTLRFINRGHDYASFVRAVLMTESSGIEIGAHLIVGFPTETREETMRMAGAISSLPIGFLKIHQLQVVKDTAMAGMFQQAPFPVFSYDEYLEFIVDFVERLHPRIVIQRLFATAPDDILIAPRWGMTRQQIIRGIEERFRARGGVQGRLWGEEVPIGT